MFAQSEYWDDVPPLGREGRLWLRRKLYRLCQAWLRADTQVDPEDEDAGPLIHAMVREVAEERLLILSWRDADTFSGRGFASGAYVLNEDRVLDRLPAVFARAAERMDAADCPALDDWLDALRRDVHYAPSPLEPEASTVLASIGRSVCRSCRRAFTPDRRRVVRCPLCRAGMTQKPAAAQT